jgi:predicted TIM-barrel fold metal-dependent hydrolase
MWIRKRDRDRQAGVDSPMPTQVVSNGEFVPRPQSERQKQVEALIGEMGTARAKKLGMDRRSFMGTAMGLATCFLAQNRVYGKVWEVEEVESFELAAVEERYPKGEYFILDVQAHFTNGVALGFRNSMLARGMGFNLKEDAEAYSFRNFTKEMFLESETDMVVISGVPTRENQRAADGRVLEGAERNPPYALLPSWLMSEKKRELNALAQSQRALCQGNLAPNHYWNRATNSIDKSALLEQMDREIELYGIDSWKWYCHTDPGGSGRGFQLDDDLAAFFYEESRKRGMRRYSVHKGYSYQSRTLGHLANPKDVEKAALDNPDLSFIIYHSAIQHGPSRPDWKEANGYDPAVGDFAWHSVLMDIKKRNPGIDNVYPELGSFFNMLAVADPVMCMHGMGQNIKHYGADHVVWGTDCLWWGSPQWSIDAFKRFQISDELCEKFGYAKLTHEDKARIFGRNAARLYGVDPDARRKAFPPDVLDRVKTAYAAEGPDLDYGAHGWVRSHA